MANLFIKALGRKLCSPNLGWQSIAGLSKACSIDRAPPRKLLAFAPVIFLGVIGGCGNKSVDFDPVIQDVSRSLTYDEVGKTEDQLQVDVARGFGPALSQAVLQNQGYLAASASEQEALNLIGVAQSARRFQVAGNSTVGAVRETGGTQPNDTTAGAAVGINVTQLVYDGGEANANVALATARAYAAQQQRIVVSNDIALQAAQAWIDVWRVQSRIGLLDERTEGMDLLISQMERAASNGMVDRAALDGARRQIVGIKLEKTRLLAELSDAELRFERYFGGVAGKLRMPEAIVDQDEVLATAKDWQNTPFLKRSAANIFIAKQQVVITQAAFGPRARLRAGVTSPMDDDDSTDTSVGLAIEYTFGDGGRREADLAAAKSRLEAAEAQLHDEKQMLKAEMAAAVSQLNSLGLSMPLLQKQIDLSRSEAQIARSQLATGQSNLRQLIEAEVDSYRAEDSKITMRAQKLSLQLTIAGRTGKLVERIGLFQTE
jgi:outer membrane protein TolC